MQGKQSRNRGESHPHDNHYYRDFQACFEKACVKKRDTPPS